MAFLPSVRLSLIGRRSLPLITRCYATDVPPTTQAPSAVVMGSESRIATPIPLPTFALPAKPGLSANLPKAVYGGRHTVAMILGDGVAPEMMEHVKAIFRGPLAVPIDFYEIAINNKSDENALMEAVLAVQRTGVAIKGSLETLHGQKSKNLFLRNQLGLFAYVQRCYSFPGFSTRHKNVDFTVIRENTEGEYSQLEHESVPGVVESMKITTREKSTRIARFAFDYALQNGRRKVTAIHKANIMKLGDGLFLNTCQEISKLYPTIEFNSMIIDNCSMQLVSRPQQFDVIVLPNLYGNIVGNLGAGLVGGAGVVAGMNLGERFVIFEAGTRKSGRKLKGLNIANPSAMLFTAADMLDHLDISEKATILRKSIMNAISQENTRTPDLNGTGTTSGMIKAISKSIEAEMELLSS